MVKFDGFLALYQEGRDEDAEDEESRRLPEMSAGRAARQARDRGDPAFHRAAAALFRGLPGQAHGGARHRPALDLRLDPAGAAGPQLRPRSTRSASSPRTRGRLVIAFLESFFARYVEYDFTADLEEQLDRVSNGEIDWNEVLRDFWRDFIGAVDEIKDLRVSDVLDALDEMLAPHIFPPRAGRHRSAPLPDLRPPGGCR